VEAEGPPAKASEAAVASEPLVADTSGVATEANAADSSELVPPPTRPNLVDPGTELIQVGHSPSAPSKAPRTRVRSSREVPPHVGKKLEGVGGLILRLIRTGFITIQGEALVVVSGCAGSPTNTLQRANGG